MNEKDTFFNKKALDFAFENGHKEIIEILEGKGLKLSFSNSSKNGLLMMSESNIENYGKGFYSLLLFLSSVYL